MPETSIEHEIAENVIDGVDPGSTPGADTTVAPPTRERRCGRLCGKPYASRFETMPLLRLVQYCSVRAQALLRKVVGADTP
jgi:hypothetical protein